MDNRELLRLAFKAWAPDENYVRLVNDAGSDWWNPLHDDGDALRLAVKLDLRPRQGVGLVSVLRPDTGWNDESYRDHSGDKFAATRRAIVCAAAEIGRAML